VGVVSGRLAARSHDAFCLLFFYTSLELLCSIVDIACISSFLSFFLHIFLGFVVNTAVDRPSYFRVNPPVGGSQRLESTTVTLHAEPFGASADDNKPVLQGVYCLAFRR